MIQIKDTFLSQYANSPTICTILNNFNDTVDPRASTDEFYHLAVNVLTAKGFGLDIWGRIVGIGRDLSILDPNADYFGFKETEMYTLFDQSPFYSGGASDMSYKMDDSTYRDVIFNEGLLEYPKGAILQSDDETREFQSLVDNNKINFNKESPEKVSAAWKQMSTTQLLDELNKKLNRSDVVQSVGNSKSQVMSQNAVTDTLNTKQDKGDYATNTALNQVNDNANSRLEKAKNGADIPDKAAFVKSLNFIEQQTGASTTTVMSQQAVTNAITHATPDASTTQKKGGGGLADEFARFQF